MTKGFITRVLIVPAALALWAVSGCAPASKQPAPMPTLTPPVVKAPPVQQNPGSIYSQAQPNFLFEDDRARRIGDIVMVDIVENSKSKLKAETKSDKDNSVEFGVENYFGAGSFNGSLLGQVGGPSFGWTGPTGTTPMISANVNNKFKSKGETKRESTVTATIACRVVNILPGGVMQIEGARQTRVNDENQIIVVRGLIRPTDIDPDNTVPSTSVADAQIEYYGEGVLADRQKPGWLTRILDNVWPF